MAVFTLAPAALEATLYLHAPACAHTSYLEHQETEHLTGETARDAADAYEAEHPGMAVKVYSCARHW